MMDYLALLSFGPNGWGDEIASGIWITVSLGLATLPSADVWLPLAMGINAKEPTVRNSAKIFTTIFRGLPELLTLFIVYYGGQILINLLFQKVFGIQVEVNSFVAGMIALSFVFASYSSEVFLSAFKGINQGQYEGSYALGLSWYKTMRLVIMPQLIKLALPGLSNLWLICSRKPRSSRSSVSLIPCARPALLLATQKKASCSSLWPASSIWC